MRFNTFTNDLCKVVFIQIVSEILLINEIGIKLATYYTYIRRDFFIIILYYFYNIFIYKNKDV